MPVYISPQDEDTWVPLREALDLLKTMGKVGFYYHVRHNVIRSHKSESNDRDNVYHLGDVKRFYAKRTNQEVRYEQHAETVLRWITPADIAYLIKLDYEVYGSYPEQDNNTFASWLERNTHMALGVFDQAQPTRCLAYVSAPPVYEPSLLRLLQTEQYSIFSVLTHIEPLTYEGMEPGFFTPVIHTMAAKSEKYLSEVLSGLVDYWKSLLPEREITRIYGVGGEKFEVLRNLGFSQVSIISQDTLLPLPAFHLEMEPSYPIVEPSLRDYQEALNR